MFVGWFPQKTLWGYQNIGLFEYPNLQYWLSLSCQFLVDYLLVQPLADGRCVWKI